MILVQSFFADTCLWRTLFTAGMLHLLLLGEHHLGFLLVLLCLDLGHLFDFALLEAALQWLNNFCDDTSTPCLPHIGHLLVDCDSGLLCRGRPDNRTLR